MVESLTSESSVIVVTHIFLATALFLLINWLGKHSVSLGYMSLTVHFKADEAPAFNFLLRSLTPVIYLFVVSSFIYSLNLDFLISDIWLIIAYYFFIRIFLNVLLNRARLLNWSYQIPLALITIALSFISYEKLIKNRDTLLPDFETMTNELWIIIALFIYALFNNLKLSSKGSINRKKKYIAHNYHNFKNKFGSLIEQELADLKLEPLIYSIMIYESFNRPPIARFLERAIFPIGKSKTLGVMQVTTNKYITDLESVKIAVNKIDADYKESLEEIAEKDKEAKEKKQAKIRAEVFGDISPDDNKRRIFRTALSKTTIKYNPCDEYRREVMRIYHEMVEDHYPQYKSISSIY